MNRRLRYLADNVPATPMIRVGKGPGCQIYYRAHSTAYGRQCGPEIFHKNKQTVLFGRHPITGRQFKWKGGSPATRRFIDVPEIRGNDLDGFLMRFGHDRIAGNTGRSRNGDLEKRPPTRVTRSDDAGRNGGERSGQQTTGDAASDMSGTCLSYAYYNKNAPGGGYRQRPEASFLRAV